MPFAEGYRTGAAASPGAGFFTGLSQAIREEKKRRDEKDAQLVEAMSALEKMEKQEKLKRETTRQEQEGLSRLLGISTGTSTQTTTPTDQVVGEGVAETATGPIATGGGFRPESVTMGGIQFKRQPTEEELAKELEQEVDKKVAMIKATKRTEADVKKEQLRKDLTSFREVDKLIDRATGGVVKTRLAGFKSKFRAVSQEGIKGAAARTHDALRKRLRVQLVRAAGDVGNINIVEQLAAEQVIPGFFDTELSAKIKNATMSELVEAIDENDTNAVGEVIRGFMKTKAFTPIEYKSVEEAEAAGIPAGTTILINGRRAVME